MPAPGSRGVLRGGRSVRRLRVEALLLAVLACALPPAFADPPPPTLDAILAMLAQHRHAHAVYSEEVESPLFKKPLHSSGELLFDAPDRLEKKVLAPAAEDLLVQGEIITIARGTHRTAVRLSNYPQLSPLLNAIRATLAGDRPALENNFQVAVNATGSGWELTLQALPSEAKPVYKRIQIRGTDGAVISVALERANGERTTMALSEAPES